MLIYQLLLIKLKFKIYLRPKGGERCLGAAAGERRRAAPPAKARRVGAGRACGGRPWRGATWAAERAGGGAGERAREEPAEALIGGGYRRLIRR